MIKFLKENVSIPVWVLFLICITCFSLGMGCRKFNPTYEFIEEEFTVRSDWSDLRGFNIN